MTSTFSFYRSMDDQCDHCLPHKVLFWHCPRHVTRTGLDHDHTHLQCGKSCTFFLSLPTPLGLPRIIFVASRVSARRSCGLLARLLSRVVGKKGHECPLFTSLHTLSPFSTTLHTAINQPHFVLFHNMMPIVHTCVNNK
jgi:hypothetical protein